MDNQRRALIKSSLLIGSGVALSSLPLWAKEQKGEKETPAVEDLMREHGGLNRILLIYENIVMRMDQKKDFDPDLLKKSASIIKNFIEDYHEKLEEEYIFPRMQQVNHLTDLVNVLKSQHEAGRKLTQLILMLANTNSVKSEEERGKLKSAMLAFVKMYRPHEAREDTLLFPEFKKLTSDKEYKQLGDKFEDREHQLFGKEGFEGIVTQIGEIEKNLGLYDLSQYTPKI